MRFIDLFAGLGGFHIALRRVGHKCVFASELDSELRALYKLNFGIQPAGDIRNIRVTEIPKHDILCAGFPCQPFSKAGSQLGINCSQWGDLFNDYVLRIIEFHEPKYIILENVPNLERHDKGKTWSAMKTKLSRWYEIDNRILSPHMFGVPQIRERLFIVGSRNRLNHFKWPSIKNKALSISHILDKSTKGAKSISSEMKECLQVWQDFLDRSPKNKELPSFPIWTMEFEATYPYEDKTPFALGPRRLVKYLGACGFKLSSIAPKERMNYLPSYARTEEQQFPKWKIDFIRQNRKFYEQNREWIDPWLPLIRRFPPSYQKLEWNCKGEERNIWNYIIQFRPSGVRVKRATTAPSLVAMTISQVPIIASQRRYLSLKECKRLQSLNSLKCLPITLTKAHKALGNAVNAKVVELICRSLIIEK